MTPGRFVLLLGILGFKEMLKSQSATQVCSVVEDVLKECDRWTSSEHNDFDTIHFSDTIVLHGRKDGAYHDWYTDLIFVGARICNCDGICKRRPRSNSRTNDDGATIVAA